MSTQLLQEYQKDFDTYAEKYYAVGVKVGKLQNRLRNNQFKDEYSYEWLELTCGMIANVAGDKKLTAGEWWELLNNELK